MIVHPRLALVACALVFAVLALACNSNGGDSDDATATVAFQGRDPNVSFSEACQKSDEKQFSKPDSVIDTSKTYVATIKTARGDIVVELFSDVPITTNNFVFLACRGYYDGLIFHRVVPDFVIQGGDPGPGPGYTIPDEDDGGHNMDIGSISFAKPYDSAGQAVPDSAGSEFFVTTGLSTGGSLAYLDADFTVFGKVTSGQDVAGQVQQGDSATTVAIEEK